MQTNQQQPVATVTARPAPTESAAGGSSVSLWADLNGVSEPSLAQSTATPDPSGDVATETPGSDRTKTP
jgi:hypothetical protein